MIKSSILLFCMSFLFLFLFILIEFIAYKIDSKHQSVVLEILEALLLYISTITFLSGIVMAILKNLL